METILASSSKVRLLFLEGLPVARTISMLNQNGTGVWGEEEPLRLYRKRLNKPPSVGHYTAAAIRKRIPLERDQDTLLESHYFSG